MQSYYESMGTEDKIRNEAFRWTRANVLNCNKTSVGRAIAIGCATRCYLSVHSLVMSRSGPDDGYCDGGGQGGGLEEVGVERAGEWEGGRERERG